MRVEDAVASPLVLQSVSPSVRQSVSQPGDGEILVTSREKVARSQVVGRRTKSRLVARVKGDAGTSARVQFTFGR